MTIVGQDLTVDIVEGEDCVQISVQGLAYSLDQLLVIDGEHSNVVTTLVSE